MFTKLRLQFSFRAIKAFTLAEVLITLTIIGVVAALTIPALMTNLQDAQFRTAWKKAYSIISQAQVDMVRDYGSVTGAFGNIDYSSDGGNNFMNGWLPYLAVTKSCTSRRIITDGCHTTNFTAMDGSVAYVYYSSSYSAGVILNDGTFINFYPGTCSGSLCTDSYLFIDVNGVRGPNILGKDVYTMRYRPTKDRFIPGGGGTTCSGTGWDCGYVYLIQ